MVFSPPPSDKRPSVTSHVLMSDGLGDKILLSGGSGHITRNTDASGDQAPDTGVSALKTLSGDAATMEFTVPFGAINPADYTVSVFNASTYLWEIQEYDVDYTFPSAGGTILFITSSIPASGTNNIEIRRHTPRQIYPTVRTGHMGQVHASYLEAPSFLAQEVEDQQIDGVYWFHSRNWANGVVQSTVDTPNPLSTKIVHMGVTIPTTFTRVWVTTFTTDATPPTDWGIKFYLVPTIGASKTGWQRGFFPLTFGSTSTSTSENGVWQSTGSPVVDTSIDVDPGQQFWAIVEGDGITTIDKIHMLMGFGWQKRIS